MYRDVNEWYLITQGFLPSPRGGYYYHYDRRIIVSDSLVENFDPEKLELHIESINEERITFLLSSRPSPGIPEEIMKTFGWEGERELILIRTGMTLS